MYHGPERLKHIASKIHFHTQLLKKGLEKVGLKILSKKYFDTLLIESPSKAKFWYKKSVEQGINFRFINDNIFGISLDETTTLEEVDNLINFFNQKKEIIDHKKIEEQIIPSEIFFFFLKRNDKIL